MECRYSQASIECGYVALTERYGDVMRTVLITGANGVVGSVLRRRLAADYAVVGLDLPEDLATHAALPQRMAGVETVIHLARERDARKTSNRVGPINPRNVRIDVNVYAAVVEAGVRRLVVASSIHADDFRSPHAKAPLTVPGSYSPATPYGSYKLLGEEIGKALASRFGFEFVALRFGGVTADNTVKPGPGREATWLSHDDLQSAVCSCIAGEPVPGRSTVFYVVSANAECAHDTSNPFGWHPKDDSARQRRAISGDGE